MVLAHETAPCSGVLQAAGVSHSSSQARRTPLLRLPPAPRSWPRYPNPGGTITDLQQSVTPPAASATSIGKEEEVEEKEEEDDITLEA